jgi:predicted nucleotide-binding protein
VIERFVGSDGERLLRRALLDQVVVGHDDGVAGQLQAVAVLQVVEAKAVLITQDAEDSDLYLVLAGSLEVEVNGRILAVRGAGTHVGEMALLDPTAKRSATVRAVERTVLARVTEPQFAKIAESAPHVWRSLAVELGDRLRQRSKYVRAPNARPKVFVACSVERLVIAEHVQAAMVYEKVDVKLWTQSVFLPGHSTLEDLLREIDAADFAVIIAHPDDLALTARNELGPMPRDNVILELGMALGALGRDRALIVRPIDDVKLPTDLLGITAIVYQDGPAETLAGRVGPVVTAVKSAVARLGCR